MKQRLANLADVRTGFPFRKAVRADPNGTLSVVQMKDIDDSAGLNPAACVVIENDAKRYEQHLLKVGDVILQSRGKTFPAAVVDKPILAIAALGLMIIRPRAVAPEYLRWALNQPQTREALQGFARGTYVPFLSRAAVEDIEIPVPTIETQRRIVEIDRLRVLENRLASELSALNNQLTDALLWKVASNLRK